MNFAPKNICGEFIKLGLKSQSGEMYFSKLPEPIGNDNKGILKTQSECIDAFVYQDIIGPSKQAKENARLLFGESKDGDDNWYEMVHHLLDWINKENK